MTSKYPDKSSLIDFWKSYTLKINYQRENYLVANVSKFVATYKIITKYIEMGSKILSIGAGSAYIEAALTNFNKAEITIIDFPEVLSYNNTAYDEMKFTCIGTNLMQECLDIPLNNYDLVIVCDIIEHLPVAPSIFFNKLKQHLKPNGYIVITTPNLGRLEIIRSLIKMQPISPSPIQFFSSVSAENENVHRREYLPVEMENELNISGFNIQSIDFFSYKEGSEIVAGNLLYKVIYSLLFKMNPKFYSCMCLVAKRVEA